MVMDLGLEGEAIDQVSVENTAASVGSGSLEVYATPSLLALIERAAVKVLDGRLEEGKTTVGTRVELRHLAGTPVGIQVRARVKLVELDGRRLVFTAEVWDNREKIAEGEHERVVVDRDTFLKRIGAKKNHGHFTA